MSRVKIENVAEKVGTVSKCAYIDGKKRDDAIDLRKKSCQLPFVFQNSC